VRLKVRFETPIGVPVEAELEPGEDLYQVLRERGAAGWTAVRLRYQGIALPLACEGCFDWRLLGAVVIERDGFVEAVAIGGAEYKRRDLAERRSLPRVIKYSRGAREGDPAPLVEGSGQDRYVTLVRFVGDGPCPPELCRRDRSDPAGD